MKRAGYPMAAEGRQAVKTAAAVPQENGRRRLSGCPGKTGPAGNVRLDGLFSADIDFL